MSEKIELTDLEFVPTQRQVTFKFRVWKHFKSGGDIERWSDRELEGVTGIPNRTISRWKQHPDFLEWVRDDTDIKTKAKGVAEIALSKLLNIVENGSDKNAMEASKAILHFARDDHRKVTIDDVSDKSEEEIDQEIEQLKKITLVD